MKQRRKRLKIGEEMVRFGISIPRTLLKQFDAVLSGKTSNNRSEAVRALMREHLAQDIGSSGKGPQAATVTVVLESQNLEAHRRFLEHCREMGGLLVSNLQVRLTAREELQVLVLRGAGAEISMQAKRILGLKGILLGKLTLTGAPES